VNIDKYVIEIDYYKSYKKNINNMGVTTPPPPIPPACEKPTRMLIKISPDNYRVEMGHKPFFSQNPSLLHVKYSGHSYSSSS
jgi:hypothetical protein